MKKVVHWSVPHEQINYTKIRLLYYQFQMSIILFLSAFPFPFPFISFFCSFLELGGNILGGFQIFSP